MMKYALLVSIALFSLDSASEANAGIFRDGKILPLIRNRVIINDRNPTPATPNPPPIIDDILVPVPQPLNNELAFEQLLEEFQKYGVEIEEVKETPIDPASKYPPWMPLAGVSGGALVALLAFLRKSLTSL